MYEVTHITGVDGVRRPHPIVKFKVDVRKAAKRAYHNAPFDVPVRVDLLFVLKRPQEIIWKTRPMPRLRHAKKPDRDNLDKGVLDALTGILWVDDSQVCDGRITKLIASGDEQAHTVVTVTPFPPCEVNNGEEEKSSEQKTLNW